MLSNLVPSAIRASGALTRGWHWERGCFPRGYRRREFFFPAGFIAHPVLCIFENITSCNISALWIVRVKNELSEREEHEHSEATRELSSVLVLIKDDKSSKKYLSTPRKEISYVPTKIIFCGDTRRCCSQGTPRTNKSKSVPELYMTAQIYSFCSYLKKLST